MQPLLQWKNNIPSVTCSEYVFVVLGVRHEKHLRRIILLFVVWISLPCFSALCYECHNFRKETVEYKMCFDFSTTFF